MDSDFILRKVRVHAGYDLYDDEFDFIEEYVLDKYAGKDEEVVIPDKVGRIAPDAFAGTAVRSITFPKRISTGNLKELRPIPGVTKAIFPGGQNLSKVVVDYLMQAFPDLVEAVFPNAERAAFYAIEPVERWPAFRFTGPIRRIFANWNLENHPRETQITLYAPEISPGYVDEAYRPSLIATFLSHPEWFDENRAKAYMEWIRKNAVKFFELCAARDCMPLVLRCASLEEMKFTPKIYDSLIRLAEKMNDTELKGVLIEKKSAQYDLEKLRKKSETQENRDMEDPLRPHAMRKYWSWSALGGELGISQMKNNEDELAEECVYVPERIGDKTVVCVSGPVFRDAKVRNIVFPETVESLWGNIFTNNQMLESVTILGRIRSIPYICFRNCQQLKHVYLQKLGIEIGTAGNSETLAPVENERIGPRLIIGTGAFAGCTRLSELSLSDTLLCSEAFMITGIQTLKLRGTPMIPKDCFSGCLELRTADLCDTVVIEEKAFQGCLRLTDVHVSGTLRSVHPKAFDGCAESMVIHLHHVEEPEYLKDMFNAVCESGKIKFRFEIEEETARKDSGKVQGRSGGRDPSEGTSWIYEACENGSLKISKIPRLPAGHIDDEVMRIPNEIQGRPVRIISDEAFIKSRTPRIELPKNAAYIGRNAFKGVDELESVSIAGDVSCIPESCFAGNQALSFVEVSARHLWIGKPYPGAVRSGAGKASEKRPDLLVIGKRAFADCTEIRELDLEYVLLCESAFRCTGVRTVTLRNTPVVPAGCFNNCYYLKEADLRGVADIQYEAFCSCGSLTDVHLSDDIDVINGFAFIGCRNLTRVHLHGVRRPELVKKAFAAMKRFGIEIDEYVIYDE